MSRRVFLLLAGLAAAGLAPAVRGQAAAQPPPSSVAAQPNDAALQPSATGKDLILNPRPLSEEAPHGRSADSGSAPLAWLAALACAAAGVWLFIRGRAARRPGDGGSGLFVAASRPLGNRQHLVVAAYGRKRFLIGVCQGSISLLSTLDDEPSSP